MSPSSDSPGPDTDVVTAGGRRFVIVWSGLLVVLFLVAGALLAPGPRRHKLEGIQQQLAQMDPQATEPGLTSADAALPEGARPIEVTTGIYVDRIIAVSVKDFEWKVEFYLWFRWEGDGLVLENGFEVV